MNKGRGRRFWGSRNNDFTAPKPIIVTSEPVDKETPIDTTKGPGAHLLSQVERMKTVETAPNEDEQFPLENMTIPKVVHTPADTVEDQFYFRQHKSTAALIFNQNSTATNK